MGKQCQIEARRLNESEYDDLILMSQFATSSSHGGVRKMPYAFTEQGIAWNRTDLRKLCLRK